MRLQQPDPAGHVRAPATNIFPGVANTDRMAAQRMLVLAWTGAVMVRLFVSAGVLNSMYPYSETGGNVLEKIHPGSYLLFLMFPLFLPRQRFDVHMRRVVFANAMLTGALVIVGIASASQGGTTAAGFLVDAVLIAPVASLSILSLSSSHRRFLAISVLAGLLVNSAVVFAELGLQQHLLPYGYIEDIFRPAGLLGHPLLSGLCSAAAIPFFFALFRSRLVKWTGAVLMFATCLACGARTASAVAAGTFLLSAVAGGMHRRPGSRFDPSELALTAATLLLCFPLLLSFFLHSPTADRLAGSLVDDQSIMSRISVYDALHFLSRSELLFGTTYSHIQAILLEGVKLKIVESPIVSAILMFGALNALLLGLGYILFFMGLFRTCGRFGRVAIIAFAIVSLSDNTLTAKSPALLAITVLSLAADERARDGSRAAHRNFSRSRSVQLSNWNRVSLSGSCE
jgi:hypothetical protein